MKKVKRVVLGEGYPIPYEGSFSAIILVDEPPKVAGEELKDIVIMDIREVRGKRIRLIAEILDTKEGL